MKLNFKKLKKKKKPRITNDAYISKILLSDNFKHCLNILFRFYSVLVDKEGYCCAYLRLPHFVEVAKRTAMTNVRSVDDKRTTFEENKIKLRNEFFTMQF